MKANYIFTNSVLYCIDPRLKIAYSSGIIIIITISTNTNNKVLIDKYYFGL